MDETVKKIPIDQAIEIAKIAVQIPPSAKNTEIDNFKELYNVIVERASDY